MQFIAGTPVGIISNAQEVIEIKLWETYLLHDRSNLHETLNTFSVDRGPIIGAEYEPGRIHYRFNAGDWEGTVKHLLYENRIPVVIKPMVVHEQRVVKRPIAFRAPVLV